MGRKGEKLGFALFYGGKQVDRLPQEALDRISERMSRVMSEYYSQHPDEYARLHIPGEIEYTGDAPETERL